MRFLAHKALLLVLTVQVFCICQRTVAAQCIDLFRRQPSRTIELTNRSIFKILKELVLKDGVSFYFDQKMDTPTREVIMEATIELNALLPLNHRIHELFVFTDNIGQARASVYEGLASISLSRHAKFDEFSIGSLVDAFGSKTKSLKAIVWHELAHTILKVEAFQRHSHIGATYPNKLSDVQRAIEEVFADLVPEILSPQRPDAIAEITYDTFRKLSPIKNREVTIPEKESTVYNGARMLRAETLLGITINSKEQTLSVEAAIEKAISVFSHIILEATIQKPELDLTNPESVRKLNTEFLIPTFQKAVSDYEAQQN